MCGKDPSSTLHCVGLIGSPPHVRERRGITVTGGDVVGITPACAGKTERNWLLFALIRDHPRMCGTDRKTQRLSSMTAGITPACAGKTR